MHERVELRDVCVGPEERDEDEDRREDADETIPRIVVIVVLVFSHPVVESIRSILRGLHRAGDHKENNEEKDDREPDRHDGHRPSEYRAVPYERNERAY